MTSPSGFEPLDHTADIGARVFAPTLDALFAEGARALFALMVDVDAVAAREGDAIDVSLAPEERGDDDAAALLFREWLAELLYRFEVLGRIYADFEVVSRGPGELRAVARGEAFDPERHPVLRPIKAVTYHGLAVRRTAAGFEATVIFDV